MLCVKGKKQKQKTKQKTKNKTPQKNKTKNGMYLFQSFLQYLLKQFQ